MPLLHAFSQVICRSTCSSATPNRGFAFQIHPRTNRRFEIFRGWPNNLHWRHDRRNGIDEQPLKGSGKKAALLVACFQRAAKIEGHVVLSPLRSAPTKSLSWLIRWPIRAVRGPVAIHSKDSIRSTGRDKCKPNFTSSHQTLILVPMKTNVVGAELTLKS